MDTELERRAAAVFDAVLDLAPAERLAAARLACGTDAALLAHVEPLVAAAAVSDRFLSAATAAPGATVGPDDAPVAGVAIAERPGSRIGRYKLLEQIGEGGFGVVFMAEQVVPVRRLVALKVIKLGMDTKEVVARFEAERQALALMDHPNIARVLDAGATEAGRPYFVMELVRGLPITEYADKRRMTTAERVSLAAQVCRAVQHAHGKGVIHRDLKPSNVLVTTADDRPVPKVIDFGIAKATQSRLTDRTLFTAFRQMIGTPQYMSPEQADSEGSDVDTRSDVYSLGVLLYELLVGSTPLDGRALRSAAMDAMRRMIREVDPPKPSTRLGGLGDTSATVAAARGTDARRLGQSLAGELDWIVMRALEKDRARRYETAAALADDLGRYLAGEAVAAGPPGGLYRARKFARKHRAAAGVAAAVAAALLLGVAGTTVGLVREARQRRLADAQRAEAVAQQAIAQAARVQAEKAQGQAEQARGEAEAQAVTAHRAAARSDARYLTGERLLPAAYARAVDAWKLGGKWEDGFTLDGIRIAARQNWQLLSRVRVDDVNTGCFVRTKAKKLVLAVTAGQELSTYDGSTGAPLARAALSSPAIKLISNDAPLDSVTVVRADGVDRFDLDGLRRVASHPLPATTVAADANAKEVLLVGADGTSRILSLADLTQTDELEWNAEMAGPRGLARPRLAAISPSGGRVVLHGGVWHAPYTQWDRRTGVAGHAISHFAAASDAFRFVDDDSLAAWNVIDFNGGNIGDEVRVYDVAAPRRYDGDAPPVRFETAVDSDDTKGAVEVQAWTSPYAAGESLGLIGNAGLLTLSRLWHIAPHSDRYANLLPTDAEPPTYLAASLGAGIFAVRQPHGVSVFCNFGSVRGLSNFSACACRAGMLWLDVFAVAGDQPALLLEPFDAAEPLRPFNLQWAVGAGATPDLLPWALCATPDGSTVVVVAQGSEGFRNSVDSIYGTAHALVYRNAGGLAAAAPVWRLDHAWDLGVAPTGPWEARHAAVDPAGRVLVYVTATGGARRFSLDDGRPLGPLPLSAAVHLSDDGALVAGTDPADGTLNVFDVATGRRVTSVPGQGKATAVCLSTDDRRVLVADGTTIRAYAVADGRPLSTVMSALRPLAVPAGNADPFVAFQADDAKSTSGNLVVADPAGRVLTLLARAGTGFCPAWFSPDGRAVAVILDRFSAKTFRSLSPDQLVAGLQGRLFDPELGRPTTMPAVQLALPAPPPVAAVLDAADVTALAAHLGLNVAVRGTIEDVSWTAAHNAVNLEFAGPAGEVRLLGWVPPTAARKFAAAMGPNYLPGLKGRRVVVTGNLVRYGGRRADWQQRLQVTLNDPPQLVMLPDKP